LFRSEPSYVFTLREGTWLGYEGAQDDGRVDLREMFYNGLPDFDGSRSVERMYCPSARERYDWGRLAYETAARTWVEGDPTYGMPLYIMGYYYWALACPKTLRKELKRICRNYGHKPIAQFRNLEANTAKSSRSVRQF